MIVNIMAKNNASTKTRQETRPPPKLIPIREKQEISDFSRYFIFQAKLDCSVKFYRLKSEFGIFRTLE